MFSQRLSVELFWRGREAVLFGVFVFDDFCLIDVFFVFAAAFFLPVAVAMGFNFGISKKEKISIILQIIRIGWKLSLLVRMGGC